MIGQFDLQDSNPRAWNVSGDGVGPENAVDLSDLLTSSEVHPRRHTTKCPLACPQYYAQ